MKKIFEFIAKKIGFNSSLVIENESLIQQIKNLENEVNKYKKLSSVATTQYYVIARCKMYLNNCIEENINSSLKNNCNIAINACNDVTKEFKNI